MPSTHTQTRKFREGDRTSDVVGHVLLKYQPYLQRYANKWFARFPDEAEDAYVELVLTIVTHPYLFAKDYGRTLRSFIFRSYKNKLLDELKKRDRWRERARRTGEHVLEFCNGRKSARERALERCLDLSYRLFINGIDADKALRTGITETDRATWKAYWEDRLSEAEIAARINRSVNAVSARILKVKAYLRQQTLERLAE